MVTERIPFRLLHMECCGTLLCHVNHRLPSYCPNCGKQCYPKVKGWVRVSDHSATLTFDENKRV